MKNENACNCAGIFIISQPLLPSIAEKMHYRRNLPPTDEIKPKKMHIRRLFLFHKKACTITIAFPHNRTSQVTTNCTDSSLIDSGGEKFLSTYGMMMIKMYRFASIRTHVT
ncbi:hypothetical protein HQN90_08830 [Paenibacillus alba]|nr:hypothetical protein [Paenibacillus alba]